MSRFTPPPMLDREQLDAARVVAEQLFREERRRVGPEQYGAAFAIVEPVVREALELTNDLRDLSSETLLTHDELWRILRYFCGPQISEEDFWTLVGRKFTRIKPELAVEAAAVLNELLDLRRLPWTAESRKPRKSERDAAILATATLLAHEHMRTIRRGTASRMQEDVVAEVLESAGLRAINLDERCPIEILDDLPRGSFSREQKIAGAKCDVPARLHDGRLLAIECKVSNGPKNGWKRLLREVGGKSDVWRQQFGTQLVTAAVICGVFDLRCLERAQNENSIALFWQHELGALRDFLQAAV
jgi:hypothetical protein